MNNTSVNIVKSEQKIHVLACGLLNAAQAHVMFALDLHQSNPHLKLDVHAGLGKVSAIVYSKCR